MVGHEIDTADGKYTDGYNDDAHTVIKGDWIKADDEDKYFRSVKKVCDYCGNIIEYNEEGYTVTYTDGTGNEEVFADQTSIVPAGDKTPVFDGEEPSREGHDFKGWDSDIADTGAPAKPGKVVKAENVTSPKTGDTSNSVMWLAVMLIGGSAAITASIAKKNKR